MCFTFLPLPIVALHNLQITLVVSVGLIVKCSQIALVLLRFSAESVASFTDNSLLSHELVAVCLSNQGKTEGEGKGGHRTREEKSSAHTHTHTNTHTLINGGILQQLSAPNGDV